MNEVRDALAALINRLDEIHDDPAYKALASYMIHGGRYHGPTYVAELARARAALNPSATTAAAPSTRPSPARSTSRRSSAA